MWNQVASEVILVIRTYAFFNRNIYILVMLIAALAGVIAYQLFVATSEMLRKHNPSYLCAYKLITRLCSPAVFRRGGILV
jgi:hypothetical protein